MVMMMMTLNVHGKAMPLAQTGVVFLPVDEAHTQRQGKRERETDRQTDRQKAWIVVQSLNCMQVNLQLLAKS